MRQAKGVFHLDTRRYRDAPSFKKTRLTSGLSDSPIHEVLEDSPVSPLPIRPVFSS
ncbi:hypothetical protein HAX54_037907, partial [Datura stramonium]|nr:hypothetical protein [Datura stramonium]